MPLRLLIAAILIPLQVFLFRRFWKWSNTQQGFPRWLRIPGAVAFALFNASLLVISFTGFRGMHPSGTALYMTVYPFLLWHFSTFIIGLLLLVTLALKLPLKGIWAGVLRIPALRPRAHAISSHPSVQRFDATRRTFLRRGMYGLTAASFGGTAYGMLIERSECELEEMTALIPGLPPAFSGYAIGLVTDVHSSLYMSATDMRRYVKILNGMGCDMILVGGDLVNGSGDEIDPFADAFSALRAPDGIYGVLGNHDFYSREPERVASTATEAGVTILRDQARVLRRGGETLTLLGIDDTGTGSGATQRIRRAARAAGTSGPQILLCHRPYFFPEAAAEGIDLMLSGHTHGGQVVLGQVAGMAFTPAALASPYLAGFYREGRSQMYVSRGIGTVGVPVRINCPPELTRIVLKPA
jgi:predicted MPP superfamily phosphohydrolase